MKAGIFYGSTTGNTANIAEEIAKAMGIGAADIHDVSKASPDDAKAYDTLILGSSTWGAGELQDDWFNFLDALSKSGLKGKKAAVFGCGDSSSFPDTFCDALRIISDAVSGAGCEMVGACEPEGYDVTDSNVCKDGKFVGLAIDEADTSKNAERIEKWTSRLKSELA